VVLTHHVRAWLNSKSYFFPPALATLLCGIFNSHTALRLFLITIA
jgi:hypothetical protein